MDAETLKTTAAAMVARGKGILAIDESHGTCGKRFDGIGVECTEPNRRAYRGLLVTAEGVEEAVAGYIMFDETIRQATDEGTSFVDVLKGKGVIPGIKVDTGAHELALNPGEKVTEGLDGLRARLAEYKELGAGFAKWRSVITIGKNESGADLPSKACVMANCHGLARYAALCQEAGIVPMVEPEILLEGDHSIERCYEVSAWTWKVLFEQLREQGVMLEGTILKTSMVTAGSGAEKASVDQVAEMTVKCLTENLPAELAGVVFLSGGQSAADSTIHLDAMNKKYADLPWPLSFSYGRALQAPALAAWGEDQADVAGAQAKLVHRCRMNGLAAKGEWSEDLEQ
jgi:fructose-bisphosphate aldolase, class I